MNNKEYEKMVKKVSPGTKVYQTLPKAFLFGGSICLIGEVVRQFWLARLGSESAVAAATCVVMIFLGAFLTGIGVYDKLAKHGGAGTAVPITGFANAVVSPAIEYKSEGFVMGVGAKMFVIAGPVLVYGTISSVVVGIIYYIMKMFGIA